MPVSLKRLIVLVPVLAVLALMVAGSARAQVPITMVDCTTGDPCIGTPGNDTINGSDRQDTIYGLEGDDVIDPGNDNVTDYVSCGPGYDVVNQMPRSVSDNNTQGLMQYGAGTDVIADDCEVQGL